VTIIIEARDRPDPAGNTADEREFLQPDSGREVPFFVCALVILCNYPNSQFRSPIQT